MQGRTTTFGYGWKTDLINRQGVPPPGSYEKRSDFMLNRQKHRGYSFSLQKKNGFDRFVDIQNPGPGKYDKFFSNYSKVSFSMRSKYDDPLQKHKNQLGPGQYNIISGLNNTGKYFYSKYQGSGCSKIGKSSRFQQERQQSPGPGKYNDVLRMNGTGTYFCSKIPSNFVKSFVGTKRPPINEASQTPGPGSYYNFSQFAALNKYGK